MKIMIKAFMIVFLSFSLSIMVGFVIRASSMQLLNRSANPSSHSKPESLQGSGVSDSNNSTATSHSPQETDG